MNNLKSPLILTYSPQLFVGYKVNKPLDQSGEYVSKEIAEELLDALKSLNGWAAHLPQLANEDIAKAQSAINKASK
jgi:hypothetical protein